MTPTLVERLRAKTPDIFGPAIPGHSVARPIASGYLYSREEHEQAIAALDASAQTPTCATCYYFNHPFSTCQLGVQVNRVGPSALFGCSLHAPALHGDQDTATTPSR